MTDNTTQERKCIADKDCPMTAGYYSGNISQKILYEREYSSND